MSDEESPGWSLRLILGLSLGGGIALIALILYALRDPADLAADTNQTRDRAAENHLARARTLLAKQPDTPLPIRFHCNALTREQPGVFEIEFPHYNADRGVCFNQPAGDDAERGRVREVRFRELVGRLREVQPDARDSGDTAARPALLDQNPAYFFAANQ